MLLKTALGTLEKYNEFKGTDQDSKKALAFRRGICVLKILPFQLTCQHLKRLKGLKNIGEHTFAIIEVIWYEINETSA